VGSSPTPAARAYLDLQDAPEHAASVTEANSHSPAWRLVFASSGSDRTRLVPNSRSWSSLHWQTAPSVRARSRSLDLNTGIGGHDPAAVAMREHLAGPFFLRPNMFSLPSFRTCRHIDTARLPPTPAVVRRWSWLLLSSGSSALGVERCLSSMAGSAHALDGAVEAAVVGDGVDMVDVGRLSATADAGRVLAELTASPTTRGTYRSRRARGGAPRSPPR
jgi:hypothetical protein